MVKFKLISEILELVNKVYYHLSLFPYYRFKKDCSKKLKNAKLINLVELISIFSSISTVKIHRFFVPELIHIFRILQDRSDRIYSRKLYRRVLRSLEEDTWYSKVGSPVKSRVDLSEISKYEFNLLSYQIEFINLYDTMKQKYNLDGYLLAFEQGLGKTITSLSLMASIKKDATILIVPKSTIHAVWVHHINTFFKEKKIWIVNDLRYSDSKNCDYYIFNYESLDKFESIKHQLTNKNTGIIVDESHNFLHISSLRTKNLITIKKFLGCKDVLLMSGTPIKALGTEMIPILTILDPFFDQDALKIFISSFGLNTKMGAHVLSVRLGLLMHRKQKTEVLKLPPKTEKILNIKTPDSREYTIPVVQKKVVEFIKERVLYYQENKKHYEKDFEEVISYLKTKLLGNPDFNRYLSIIEMLKNVKFNPRDKKIVDDTKWANEYEKNVLYDLLTPDLKKKFLKSKSVVKYVELKIMGEVLGGLLIRLRTQMVQSMIEHSNLIQLINNSEKKTILYTSFVDCADTANEYLKKNNFDPILIYGKTTKNIKELLAEFKNTSTANPLIATIQTLSTGVTITEANTVIFLNKPWRYSDYQQASDRIHRIGQDTEVFIYTLLLDTGNTPNLSTRMEEVMNWSKELFDILTGSSNDKK